MYSNIRYIYTSALTKNNSRMMRLQLQESVNSKGILFTIYRQGTQPMSNYNHTEQDPYGLKGHSTFKSVCNSEAS
jgi:hypothetical protein